MQEGRMVSMALAAWFPRTIRSFDAAKQRDDYHRSAARFETKLTPSIFNEAHSREEKSRRLVPMISLFYRATMQWRCDGDTSVSSWRTTTINGGRTKVKEDAREAARTAWRFLAVVMPGDTWPMPLATAIIVYRAVSYQRLPSATLRILLSHRHRPFILSFNSSLMTIYSLLHTRIARAGQTNISAVASTGKKHVMQCAP